MVNPRRPRKVYLTDAEWRAVTDLARAKGEHGSAWIRALVLETLDRIDQVEEAVRAKSEAKLERLRNLWPGK